MTTPAITRLDPTAQLATSRLWLEQYEQACAALIRLRPHLQEVEAYLGANPSLELLDQKLAASQKAAEALRAFVNLQPTPEEIVATPTSANRPLGLPALEQRIYDFLQAHFAKSPRGPLFSEVEVGVGEDTKTVYPALLSLRASGWVTWTPRTSRSLRLVAQPIAPLSGNPIASAEIVRLNPTYWSIYRTIEKLNQAECCVLFPRLLTLTKLGHKSLRQHLYQLGLFKLITSTPDEVFLNPNRTARLTKIRPIDTPELLRVIIELAQKGPVTVTDILLQVGATRDPLLVKLTALRKQGALDYQGEMVKLTPKPPTAPPTIPHLLSELVKTIPVDPSDEEGKFALQMEANKQAHLEQHQNTQRAIAYFSRPRTTRPNFTLPPSSEIIKAVLEIVEAQGPLTIPQITAELAARPALRGPNDLYLLSGLANRTFFEEFEGHYYSTQPSPEGISNLRANRIALGLEKGAHDFLHA